MANKFEHALAAVSARLADLPEATIQLRGKLASHDPEVAAAAAMEVIAALSQAPKVLVELDTDDGEPVLWADRHVEIAILRSALQGHPNDGIIQIEDPFLAAPEGCTAEAIGTRRIPTLIAGFVHRTFAAIDLNKEERAVQAEVSQPEIGARRFRIHWVHGYGDQPPQEQAMTWFSTGRGFEHTTIRALAALAALDVGGSLDEIGPMDKITITRIA